MITIIGILIVLLLPRRRDRWCGVLSAATTSARLAWRCTTTRVPAVVFRWGSCTSTIPVQAITSAQHGCFPAAVHGRNDDLQPVQLQSGAVWYTCGEKRTGWRMSGGRVFVAPPIRKTNCSTLAHRLGGAPPAEVLWWKTDVAGVADNPDYFTRLTDGSLVMVVVRRDSPTFIGGLDRSLDHGRPWPPTSAIAISLPPNYAYGPIIELPDGQWAYCPYYQDSEKKAHSLLMWSRYWGQTWMRSHAVPYSNRRQPGFERGNHRSNQPEQVRGGHTI